MRHSFFEILSNVIEHFPELSPAFANISGNVQLLIRFFLKYLDRDPNFSGKSVARPDMMMGADAPIPPRARSAAVPKRDAPAADQMNTFPEKIAPPQIPFNRREASSHSGDARAAGAKPPRARSAEKSRQQQESRRECKIKESR
jgi:hypothetical protein